MQREELYELPIRQNKHINKKQFVIKCLCYMALTDVIASAILVFCFGSSIGFFPIHIYIPVINVMGIWGCIYYIRKHDYAYGNIYEQYQVVNAIIYGIQNILRALLVLLIFSVFIVPVYYLILVAVVVIVLFRITRRW